MVFVCLVIFIEVFNIFIGFDLSGFALFLMRNHDLCLIPPTFVFSYEPNNV